MDRLAERLIALGFIPDKDFVCRNDLDERGDYIEAWKSASPPPTEAELAAVELPE